MTDTRLTLVQRGFVAMVRLMTRVAAGYDMHRIQEEMVRTLGIRGTMRLMKMGAELTATLAGQLGDYTAQTLIAIAAMWNGCRYCVIGHNFSANLFRFRDTGSLGPLDEDELVELMRLTDDELHEALRQRFEASEPRLWHLVDRMFLLRFRDLDPVEPEDHLLKATLSYWEWLNECTIVLGVDAESGSVPALGFMRASDRLVQTYREARRAAIGTRSGG